VRALKWLFHPVNLLIIVVLVALYLNRQTLFPELAESPEVRQLVSRVDGVITSINNSVAELQNSVEGEVDIEVADTAQAPPDPAVSSAEKESQHTSANSEHGVQQEQAPLTAQAPTSPSFDDLPDMRAVEPEAANEPAKQAAQEEEAVSPVEETKLETVVEQLPLNAGGSDRDMQAAGAERATPAAEPLALWKAARRAAWAGKSEAAVEHYRALIALQPDNYDAYGELGNVLLRQGEREAAAEAYYQAAMRLTRSNYPQVAWRVLDIVSRLDQEKASQLYQAMREQQLSSAQPRRQTPLQQ